MRTIVEPKELIDKLWGKQRIKDQAIYREMRYVLRVNHDDKVLLHNVVTGHLVVLDEAEKEVLEMLPKAYSPEMEQLVTEHYLVPENYDEHQQVVNLRNILWKMFDAQSSKDITYYTIFPTTACNARCWYCYEKDITPLNMTEETAKDVVGFIARSCGKKPVRIRWLGGEPTLAANRIDQISKGLLEREIEYSSSITTNGYLFDEEMAIKAKNLWHTYQVNISIDGTEETYNRVKDFQGVKDNPYQRMMSNAEILMKHGIAVVIRMNYDRDTWTDFPKLLQEFKGRFRASSRWMLHPHQINWDVPLEELREWEDWLDRKNNELYELARLYGNYQRHISLPSLRYLMCEAGDSSCASILPDGKMVCCPEQIGNDQIKGSIYQGITNTPLVASWRRFADHERCRNCSLFPNCPRMVNCSSKDRCTVKVSSFEDIEKCVIACYEEFKPSLKEEVLYGFQRTDCRND